MCAPFACPAGDKKEKPTYKYSYVHRSELSAGHPLLFYHDALLGIVGQYTKTCRQDMALRAILLGLCNRHPALLTGVGIDCRQLRYRRAEVSARSGAGQLGQYRQCFCGRRRLQCGEYPAIGRDCRRRYGRGLPGGNRPCARAGRTDQLHRVGQRRSGTAVRRRSPGDRGHRTQRHRLQNDFPGQPFGGIVAGNRPRIAGRIADVVLLPLCSRLDGPGQFCNSGRR